ncbi:MAG: hypothetical protein IPJ65_11920 [Archangiaceae bacterium]|nr:hypothetical protein [Archangiaceae bacterium]
MPPAHQRTPPRSDDAHSSPLEPLEHLVPADPALYVCPGCPLADDANPGTQDLPLRSLSAGLQRGPHLRLASAFGLGDPFVYAEEGLALPPGARLEGRWFVTGTAADLTWLRGLDPAVLVTDLHVEGGSVQLDGLTVHGRVVLTQTDAALSDVEVTGSAGTALEVHGGTLALDGVHVGAGTSVGLSLSQTRARLRDVHVEGMAVAVVLDRPVLLEWRGGAARAYLGTECAGIRWVGGAELPSLIEDVEATGCLPVQGATSPLTTTGIDVEGCGPASAELTLRRVHVVGGWLGAGYPGRPASVGVRVAGQCPVTLEQSEVLGAVDAMAEPPHSNPRSAVGVLCQQAPCVLSANRSITGASGAAAADVVHGVLCDHGCRELKDNRHVAAGAGAQQYGVRLDTSSPRVVRNAITSAGAAPSCTRGVALQTEQSESLIADNFIVAPDCRLGGLGVALGEGSPLFVLNTVLGLQAAVRLDAAATLVDNLLQVDSGGVVLESTGPAPAALRHNDLFVKGAGGVLYRRQGVDLTAPAQVGTGTLSVDPQLGADPPHLSPTSGLRGAGVETGLALDLDFDGEPRPAQAPDVGADQLP